MSEDQTVDSITCRIWVAGEKAKSKVVEIVFDRRSSSRDWTSKAEARHEGIEAGRAG
jgi:hypothetical protein